MLWPSQKEKKKKVQNVLGKQYSVIAMSSTFNFNNQQAPSLLQPRFLYFDSISCPDRHRLGNYPPFHQVAPPRLLHGVPGIFWDLIS